MSDTRASMSFEKLRGRENFDTWKVAVKSYLIIKKLWQVIEEDISPETSPNTNAQAISELTLSIESSLYNYIEDSNSANVVWKGFLKAFDDSGTARKVTIMHELVSVKLTDSGSMEKYINKILLYWNKSKVAGFKIEEQVVASLMLGGLPEEYRPMVLGIENSAKELTVDYVKTVLLQGIRDPILKRNDGETALAAKFKRGGKSRPKRKCYSCGSVFHLSFNCPKNSKKKSCYNCGQNTHLAKQCTMPKKNQNENNKEEKSKGDQKDKVLILLLNTDSNDDKMKNGWFIDSGATAHMTHRKDMLHNERKIEKKEILIANKEKLRVDTMGDVKINLLVGGEVAECIIKNVYYVPNLCTSLLSVNQLNKQGYSVIFENNGCLITNKNEVVARAELIDNMYKLSTVENEKVFLTAEEKRLENAQIWHRRLGHIGFGSMKFLKENCEDMIIPDCRCITCIKGKQTRDPFTGKGKRAEEPLELIHSDVVGPMPVSSLSGQKYFVTFIDDFSKKLHAYAMKQKSEVFELFVVFHKLAEKQTGKKIKVIRSDNGTEYVNKQFEKFCEDHGIIHQKTVPYTPQLNGVAERMNRTILDRIRCMLIDADLDQEFWAEALNTATVIMNLIPRGSKFSPNELWNNEKFDLKSLRVFGCKAMAHIPKEKRKKLDEKSIECIFVGYANNAKGYRLYDPESEKIIISRDVVFIEDQKVLNVEEEMNLLIKDQVNIEEKVEEVKHPNSYTEAMSCEKASEWKEAMNSEYKSLIENETWVLNDAPKDRKIVKCKWVFTTKRDVNGKILKYKARLVAKGYSQEEGIDYNETFSPVVRYSSIRLLLSLAAKMNLNIRQMDAVTAFLNGILSEEIWMEQPEGYSDQSNKCCKLLRAIYGLKQASRVWNLTINDVLLSLGLKRSIEDQCIYFAMKNNQPVIVAIYVDDILIITSLADEEEQIVKALNEHFKMKDLGEATSVLGVKINRKKEFGTISISQERYINDMLERFGLNECKPAKTPIDVNQKISSEMSPGTEEEAEEMSKIPYRECIGSLLFAAQISRPDISYAVNLLSRFCEKPGKSHWIAAKRILRYLRGSKSFELIYGQTNNDLTGYCDADWAGDIDNRKSTTGYLFTLNGGAITWNTRRQPTIALSTTEAEFMSMVCATQEALWLKQLLSELFTSYDLVVKIFCDNKGAIQLAKNNAFSARSKHIDIKHKFIHEKINENQVEIEYLATEEMPADILTKACSASKIMKHIPIFGLNDIRLD